MFKIPLKVAKGATIGNKLKIVGIASSPMIDSHKEMFAPEAIKKMCEDVITKKIPIRVEHQSVYYSDIGTWTGASIDENNMLCVEGEMDLDFSLAKDAQVILSKG